MLLNVFCCLHPARDCEATTWGMGASRFLLLHLYHYVLPKNGC